MNPCKTPGCTFTAKVGTPLCGFCTLAAQPQPKASAPKPAPAAARQTLSGVLASLATAPEPGAAETPDTESEIASPASESDSEEPPAQRGRFSPTPCSATARSGDPCGFAARRGSGLCVNHDPAYREQQRENILKGSANSLAARKQPRLAMDDLDLSTRTGIQAALDAVLRLEFAGRIDPKRTRNLLRGLTLAARNFDPLRSYDLQLGHRVQHDEREYNMARFFLTQRLESILPQIDPPK